MPGGVLNAITSRATRLRSSASEKACSESTMSWCLCISCAASSPECSVLCCLIQGWCTWLVRVRGGAPGGCYG